MKNLIIKFDRNSSLVKGRSKVQGSDFITNNLFGELIPQTNQNKSSETKNDKSGNLLNDLNNLFSTSMGSGEFNIQNISNNPGNIIGDFNLITTPKTTGMIDFSLPNQNENTTNMLFNFNNLPASTAQIDQNLFNSNSFPAQVSTDIFQNTNISQNNIDYNPNSSVITQAYNGKDIAFSYTLIKNYDLSISGVFYASNNSNQPLSNVKMSFMVPRHISLKVISTSGSSLQPKESLGIRKEFVFTNSEPDRKIVMKIKFSYTINNQEVYFNF
jgi:hypothetical protein